MIRTTVLAIAVVMAVPAVAGAYEQADSEQFQTRMARARALYSGLDEAVVYCRSCGDPATGAPLPTTELDPFSKDSSIGIADVYLRTEPGWFRNLAYLAGFEPEDTPPSLRVEPSGTGELITPSDDPVTPEPVDDDGDEIAGAAICAAAPPTPTSPEIHVVHVHNDNSDPIAMIALGVSSATATALAWLLLVTRRRRRRTLLPRATELRE